MENKQKVLIAKLSVMFVLAGLSKVIQKQADEHFQEKWPTKELPAE